MKKIGSILFLLILIFNFWGYKWALSYLEQKATIRLEQRLDAGAFGLSSGLSYAHEIIISELELAELEMMLVLMLEPMAALTAASKRK